MDQARFDELKKKRFEEGLTDEEADELGRMFAEREGEPYQSADEFREEKEAEVAAELAGGEPEPGTAEDRPETAVEEAEARPAPHTDVPAGTRAPRGARGQGTGTEEGP